MSDWIAVCGEEGSDPIEIETEEDGTLLLENLTANFPGTTTLKYRNAGSNAFRALKCAGGVLKAPAGGWDQVPLYICVNPTKPEAPPKRKAEAEEYRAPEKRRAAASTSGPAELDPLATIDLILLGLKPTTTEEDIRKRMEEFGPVTMIQLKKSKDVNVGYAFIRFKDKEVERKVLKEKHTIDGRECVMRIPDSQQGGDKALRKVYVSYHSPTLTKDDFVEHFDRFGDVVDVFIPDPWRHFAFVTFAEQRVAASLIGKEHNLKGQSLLIKSAANVRGKRDDKFDRQDDFGGSSEGTGMGQQQMGGGYGAYGMPPWGGADPRMMSQGWGMMGGPGSMGAGAMGPGAMGPGSMGAGGMGMGGMGDKVSSTGMPWAGSQNYGYGPPPTHQSSGMMDRKASAPRTSRFGI